MKLVAYLFDFNVKLLCSKRAETLSYSLLYAQYLCYFLAVSTCLINTHWIWLYANSRLQKEVFTDSITN